MHLACTDCLHGAYKVTTLSLHLYVVDLVEILNMNPKTCKAGIFLFSCSSSTGPNTCNVNIVQLQEFLAILF